MVRPALATYIGSCIKLMSWRIPRCVDHEFTAIIIRSGKQHLNTTVQALLYFTQ